MRAGIEAGFEAGKAGAKFLKRAGAAAGKARFFPDFVEAARVASVAALQVDGADAKPARDPDVDGICRRKRASAGGNPMHDGRTRRDGCLTECGHCPLCADKTAK